MTTGKDDKGFFVIPVCRQAGPPALAPYGAGLVGNHFLEIYNPLFTEWLLLMAFFASKSASLFSSLCICVIL